MTPPPATATARKDPEADMIVSDVREYRELPLSHLRISPLNPRKHYDEQRLEELAASMRNGVGVLEPLVVRAFNTFGLSPDQVADTAYEIVAGARRFKAAALAGLETVPVSIRKMTDAQVLEVMVIENNQREDVTPLEEAAGFKQLLVFGFTIDDLARRIGHTRRYIYDRVQLLQLVDEAKLLLEGGVITVGHAVLLSREKAADQRRALTLKTNGFGGVDSPLFEREDTLFTPAEEAAHKAEKKDNRYAGYKCKTVRELEVWINEHCRFEASTPVAAELFPETASTVESEAKVVAITYAHHTHPDAKVGLKNRIYSVVSWKRADGQQRSKTCEYSVPGMVVAGAGRGESFLVCVNKDKCRVHWASDVKRREAKKAAAAKPTKAAKAPSAAAQKKADAKRAKEEAAARERELADERRELVVERAIDEALEATSEVTPRLLRWAVATFAGNADQVDERLAGLIGYRGMLYNLQVKDLEKVKYPALIKAWLLTIIGGVIEYGYGSRHELIDQLMQEIGVDVKKIDAAVLAEQKAAAEPKPRAGVCRFCGCTEDAACAGGCAWVDAAETVCSTPSCVAALEREKKTAKASAKKGGKK